MKTAQLLFLSVMMIGGLQFAAAQTYQNEQDPDEEIVIQNENLTTQVLQDFGFDTATNPVNASLNSSAVRITQIGAQNFSSVINNTQFSAIEITQNGDENNTQLDYTARSAVATLLQNGNQNTLIDYVNNPGADVSLQLEQQGSGLYFERFGTNSITESLRFTQTEAAPTIIVRSFQ
ncbi:hypothetical protein [Croceiramulus getboli]|nr:hypothetical protein P8624_08040 [Flavobacteriaceae bacterium YJPT1-3]